jgi:hypothetical protein
MGKKSAATRSSAQTAEQKAVEKAQKLDPYGFEQFAGEGPLFWIRQLAGLFIVILGSLVLASSYTEEHWYLPFDPQYGAYASLALIAVGAIVHEFRPWKARPNSCLLMNAAQLLICYAFVVSRVLL